MITLCHESRFGLARGAIFYQGRPHLYVEGYDADPALTVLGTRSVARLKSKSGGVAFLMLADGGEAVLDVPQERLTKLAEGAAVEVEIAAEARRNKLSRARLIAPAEGEPRRLSPVLSLKDRLLTRARVCFGETVVEVDGDPDALDAAEEAASDPSGPLTGGGYLSLERTRALIACDVDSATGGQGMTAAPKTFVRACNEQAAADLPRRLRLSGLAGLVVVDLIGRRHDAERLRDLLMTGFGGETEGVIVAPVGKFGTMEFVRPWSACPLIDTPAALRRAQALLREAARRAAAEPGRFVTMRAPHPVLDIVRSRLAGSVDPLAPLIRLEAADIAEVILS